MTTESSTNMCAFHWPTTH